MVPVIVLSAKTMALGVVRALGTMGVPVVVLHYDPQDIAQYSKYVVESVPVPHPEVSEEGFVSKLIDLSAQWKEAVIMPVSDETLVVTSRHKKRLTQYFRVACPDYALMQQTIEKHLTYSVAEEAGVAVPKTFLPISVESVKEFSNKVVYPCLIKPSQSHLFYAQFRTKMFLVKNPRELNSGYLRASEAGLDVMIQELIPGSDRQVVNYNVYAQNGIPLLEFTAEHVRNAPPQFGSPRVALSKKFNLLLDDGRKLMRGLNYTGYACTEFKLDTRDGRYKLMEVNGRHNLSTLLAVRCGINFPWLEYRHLAYGETPTPLDFTENVYWIDMLRDLAYSAKHLMREEVNFTEYFEPYEGTHIWALQDKEDPQPFRQRLAYIACHGWKGRPGNDIPETNQDKVEAADKFVNKKKIVPKDRTANNLKIITNPHFKKNLVR